MNASQIGTPADAPALTDDLIGLAISLGADKAASVATTNITFSPEFKDLCAQNACGKYNTNWMCPPAIGSIEDGIEKVRGFQYGIVVQTITQLEDSFDFEGMQDAAIRHDKVFRNVIKAIKSNYPNLPFLALSVGGCSLCKECTYPENKPCRHPELALSSVEAFGIDVNRLLTTAGLKYNNGAATVSYVGLIVCNP